MTMNDSRPEPTRRRLLIASVTGLAVGSGVLPACAGPQTPAEAPVTPGPDSERRILGPTSDVPVGGGVVYSVERVVVTQPQAGMFIAHGVVCPHQGCSVTEVTDAGILCPCHDSLFDPETGQPLAGPATSGLSPRIVTVDGPDLILG
jgi:Rieske Fe-S protein